MDDNSSDEQLTQDSNDTGDEAMPSIGIGGQQFQIVSQDDNGEPGIHTITMSNVSSSGGLPSSGQTILQYAQGPDGQYFIPVHQLSPSDVVSLSQGLVVTAGGVGLDSATQMVEEASRKRELRLLKNKEAAKECRRKKKEYVKCLENRVAVLENQNKTLIEELKSLKELYCQKDSHS